MATRPSIVPLIMVYPDGHDLAGKWVERKRTCSRCDQPFEQSRIDPSWLNEMKEYSGAVLADYLRSCEVERIEGERHVYVPARCPKCCRVALLPGDLSGLVAR